MINNQLNQYVFVPATLAISFLLIVSSVFPNHATDVFNYIQSALVTNTGWFYVLTVAIILIFVLYLGASKYGTIRLGPDHSTPDYSFSAWLSMLFAAGMGIGLMFFGVAEPVMHYLAPPKADVGTLAAVKEAMSMTFFHWGVHAWAIYTVVALILAYFCYRQNLPLTLRSALYPLIGDKIYGWRGHLVDIFAVVSTVFGTATSLGIGASQVNSGLNYLFELDITTINQVLIMVVITILASISVATGLDKGIKRLSEANMILAILLMLLVFIAGSSVFLLQAYVQNIGAYVSDIVRNTFNLFAYEKTDWIGGWTIFYWGWWLAWAPFVGLFIARISRGRTIKEFIFGAMLVPTAFTLLWMTIFGNSAISLIFDSGINQLADMVNSNTSVALFVFLENLPYSNILSFLSVLMIVIFFVTSCDSGAMVVDMLCSNGKSNTPVWQRLFWAIGMGTVAAILSLVGGLSALQTMTIAAAFPFAIILIIAMIGLMNALRIESAKRESLQMNLTPLYPHSDEQDWKERLDNIIDYPSKSNVTKYINTKVQPAMIMLKQYFSEHNMEAVIENLKDGIQITVQHGDEHEFVYGVYCRKHAQPDYTDDVENDNYYRAEVHLAEGGQDYDIMGWSKHGVLNDMVDQYHKHQHFLHVLR
ncbi:MAG: BCCT family transporter [Gammaproteobacteria bacterium]|nr:BCCT family transporter [Gammaproteobacteria bacterium]